MSTRLKDWPTTATTVDADDYLAMDGETNNSQKILGSSLKTDFASTYTGAPTTYKLTPLNGSNKVDATYLPTGAANVKGEWNASTNTPTLADGTGTEGDEYDVTVAGSQDLGSGSITFAVGDKVRYNDSSDWYKVPGVANIYDGSATKAAAATAGDYYQTADVNDRTNARQPANGVYLNGDDAYLAIADNDLLSFGDGTNDKPFTMLAWLNPADATSFEIVSRDQTGGSEEWSWLFNASDKQYFEIHDDSAAVSCYRLEDVSSVSDGITQCVAVSYDGTGGASAADGIAIYNDKGVVASTASNNASYVAMENLSQETRIGRRDSNYSQGKFHGLLVFNRALSASEIAAIMAKPLVEVADQWGGSAITSGTLEVGQRYRITDFQSGDDFTNVGAGSNANDIEFIATGTTPTTWSNSSGVTPIGAVAAYFPESVESDGSIRDSSSNGLHASGTNTSALRKTQVVDIDAVSPAADSMLLDVKVAGSSKAGIDAEGTIRQENLATDAAVGKYAADAITTAGTVSHQIPIDIGGTIYYLVAHTHGS